MIIPIGTEIVVPVTAIHKDPDFWESSEDFIPQRFSFQKRGPYKVDHTYHLVSDQDIV